MIVCYTQPVRVCCNVTFIANLNALDDQYDIPADENGVWKRKDSPVVYVNVHTKGKKPIIIHHNHNIIINLFLVARCQPTHYS